MLQFLKYVLATIFGLVLFCILFVVIITAIAASGGDEKDVLKENSVLHLKLNRELSEREQSTFLAGFRSILFGDDERKMGLIELRMAVREAAKNEHIKGIYLETSGFVSGLAKLDELRNELQEFKKSGKFIIAYSESYSEAAYYLSSVADKVYMLESGLLEVNGLRAEIMYFKGTLEKLEIKPEIFRVGEYKSAVEPFFRENMSDENREQILTFLSAINVQLIKKMAESRKIPLEQMQLISDSMLVHNAKDAVQYKLVDQLGYYEDVLTEMKKLMKMNPDDKINFVGYKKLSDMKMNPELELNQENEIAVIIASGEIIDGRGDKNSIGSESISEQIRKARHDKNVKAVVIRINSPGGSAMASDVIWNEIRLTSKEKPVIASMSDVAASGGYYMAMACDTIVASPVTITGSVGVWGLMFNAKDFMKNKLGITTDRVKTGKFSDVGSFTRDMTDYERKMIQREVEAIYTDFVTKAAQARRMTYEQMDKYAGGRVWAGTNAMMNKMIDVYGGLDDAIQIAAKSAGVKEYSVTYLPKRKLSIWKEILEGIDEDEETEARMQEQMGEVYYYMRMLKNVKSMEGIQARLPFEMVLE